jgi:HK97 gp10 family phage protein
MAGLNNYQVLVTLHNDDINAVKRDPAFGAILLNTVRATVLRRARDLAPVRKDGHSRGGRDSIQATLITEATEQTVRVSWDDAHNYMRFPNFGANHNRAVHFLEQAAREYATGGWTA